MGVLAASAVLILWTAHLVYALTSVFVSMLSVQVYVHMLFQAYLYTGLFITAHDAMHGSISKNRSVNRFFGAVSAALFAAFSYKRMFGKHMDHHRYAGTESDPDFSSADQRFLPWLMKFFVQYVTLLQLVIMAAAFNILNRVLGLGVPQLVLFWIIPAFLSTLQLFTFGTYLPHRRPHTEEMKPHNARSQRKNHVLAMVSCYFFGYHYEHHAYPRTPWWKLHARKE